MVLVSSRSSPLYSSIRGGRGPTSEVCRGRSGRSGGSGGGGGRGISPSDVGVICLTRQQARTVRLMLRGHFRARAASAAGASFPLRLGAVRVGTVDDFQGQEVGVVLVSTVAAVPPSSSSSSSSSSSFRLPAPLSEALSDPRVFNVAVTRARRLLVVVGCPLALLRGSCSSSSSGLGSGLGSSSNSSSSHPPPPLNPWLELLRHVVGRGAFLGCGSDALEGAIRSSGAGAGGGGGRPRSSAAGKQQQQQRKEEEEQEEEQDDDGGGEDDPELDDLSAAAVRVAELALLGSGRARELFPESLDDLEESLGGSGGGGGGGGTRLAL